MDGLRVAFVMSLIYGSILLLSAFFKHPCPMDWWIHAVVIAISPFWGIVALIPVSWVLEFFFGGWYNRFVKFVSRLFPASWR